MKLTSVRVSHFKAVEDSGLLQLGPLTAFVGYNGTGKSSLLEACEFFQTYALHGLDAAVQPWFGFEHLLWQGTPPANGRPVTSSFRARCKSSLEEEF